MHNNFIQYHFFQKDKTLEYTHSLIESSFLMTLKQASCVPLADPPVRLQTSFLCCYHGRDCKLQAHGPGICNGNCRCSTCSRTLRHPPLAFGNWMASPSHDWARYYGDFEYHFTCAADDTPSIIKQSIPCRFDEEERALKLVGEKVYQVVRFETDGFSFDASDSFTIMRRTKPERLSGTQAFVVKGNGEWDYGIWLRDGLLMTGSHHNSQRSWTNGSYKITKSQWHHIAYVYDDGTSKMYVNGRDVGMTKTYRINMNGTGGNWLGFGSIGEVIGNKFKGLMSEVAIFNEALPPKDIYKLALSGFCTHPNTFLSTNGYCSYPYIAPVSRQLRLTISATSFVRDPTTIISASYLTVDGGDQVEMRASDGVFDNTWEEVNGVTRRHVETVGIHEICVWAVDSNGYEGDRDCNMMPVYDNLEGYIVGSGAVMVRESDFTIDDLGGFWGHTFFVIKYKENERDGDSYQERIRVQNC
mmetsp:Transcript_7267/g.13386  ORF Transcript_7267/g.13386 Transcript_7267/m.13386 type:complete len:471 (+) Transcript_7267:713-2125(+)